MAEIAVGQYSIIYASDDLTNMSVLPAALPSAGEIKEMKLLDQKDMFKYLAILLITVSSVGIVGDLSIGVYADPTHDFFLKLYAVAVLAAFAFGMGVLFLSVLLPRVPVSVAVAKKLVWVAVALLHVALALKMTLYVIY